MDIIKPRTLSGFMELLPAKQAQFERMLKILRETYASYGFAALDTPVIEDAQPPSLDMDAPMPVSLESLYFSCASST